MKEAREAHLLTASMKPYVENARAKATSAASKVGSVSVSLTKLVTPEAGGRASSDRHGRQKYWIFAADIDWTL